MKLTTKFYSLLIFLTILSCKGQTSENIINVDPKGFSKEIAMIEEPQLIDVRTPEEFNAGHILDAKNINWLGNDFVPNIEKLDKSQPVFVYCKSGGRSSNAAKKLEELGFKKIYNLQGGMMSWDANDVSKSSDQIIGMCSQEYAALLNTDKKVLIDFNAKWCAPCKKMAPYLDRMQKDCAEKVVIIRLDADENKTLIKEMKISELPTLLLYEKKELKWKNSGYISEEELKKQLQ
ncbi:thioredoxin domain-containing protein [Flavobacterium sp.]|uniref:thioredoxin domain-containing protein n=1 Tax=Flavobacterium sp. TaxID=239 RepID=UPI00286E4B90|nr:thioredoxin domain-containing protein [Flavobacterium sp.]